MASTAHSDGTAAAAAKPKCKHVFNKKMLTKPVPTYCTYCAQLIWVFEGPARNCTLCNDFLHERCFREVVSNLQRAHIQAAEARRRELQQQQQPQQQGGASPLLATPATGTPHIAFDDDDVASTFDVIDANTVTLFEPPKGEPLHVHQFYEDTFLTPTTCKLCHSLLLGLRKQGLSCFSCDVTAHRECAAKLPADHAILLDDTQYKALVDSREDPLRAPALSDTFAMLDKFSTRNKRWQLGIINPLSMHRLYSEHTKLFDTMCEALPNALPIITTAALEAYMSALRFATAVYGRAFEEGMMNSCLGSAVMRVAQRHLLTPKDEVNNCAVMDVLGMPRECMLMSRWGTKVLEPSFAVIVDHADRRVILAFRGSLTDADFLTDACGETREFCGGMAHSGMSKIVDTLFEEGEVVRVINDALRTYDDYKLLVTGHSLAAGLTLLFVIKALKTGCFGKVVPFGIAFAPPPVVGSPLADQFDDHLVSIVAGTDVVCRLQYNSLDRLCATLSDHADPSASDLTEETHIAGKILMATHPGDAARDRLVHVRRGAAVLHQIFVTSAMVSSHLMSTYHKGLAHARDVKTGAAPNHHQH